MSKVLPLFPIPIYISEKYSLVEEEINVCKSFYKNVTKNVGGNHTSKETYVLKKCKELNKLKEFIKKHLDKYWHDTLLIDADNKLRITQSWINFNEKNTAHHIHSHSNSIISGVFYIENSTPLVFEKAPLNSLVSSAFKFNYKGFNQFNCQTMNLDVKQEQLVLFPSNLLHHVTKNQNENCRISLSLNTFVSGTFGERERLSQLTI